MFDLVQNIPLQMWFQHILPNTLRWMRLMYENVLWDASYFRHLNNTHTTQKSHCKNFWWKSLKVKAASLIFVTKNKNEYVKLFLNQMYFLVLRTRFFFLRVWSGAQVKFFDRVEIHLSRAVPSGDLLLDLVIFTEEIWNGKLHFLCSVLSCHQTFMLAREFPWALKLQFCWICYHIVGVSSL